MAADSIPVIVGPTAAGKSAIALWLASERGAVTVVSADSRQVYRGFDVGTAKPTPAEQAAVPHRGIDVADPIERFSSYRWADLAAVAIDEARSTGRTPVVVGGTGMYVRTLFEAGFREPPLDAGRRERLHALLAVMSTDELRRWCRQLDPDRAALGRVQLARSIEIALLAGERLSDLHRRTERPPRWRARYLVVDPGAALHARIADRTVQMLAGAWQAEVQALARRVPLAAPAWNASGYASVLALVQGTATLDETIARVVVETRQYAKRQRTWFRNQLPAGCVTQVDPTSARWQEQVARWWDDGEEGMQA